MEPTGAEPGPTPAPSPAVPAADRVARLVTEIFAPAVLVAVLLVVVGWHAYDYSLAGVAWGLAAALFASVIPFAVILRGVRQGTLSDHHIGRREQRRGPLLIALACLVAGLAGMVVLGAEWELLAALGAGACGLVVSMLVNNWWKMSVHTGVAAGAVVVFMEIYGPVVLVTVPLVFLVAWSRVRLGDHTVAQTVVGGVAGALVAGLAFAVLR